MRYAMALMDFGPDYNACLATRTVQFFITLGSSNSWWVYDQGSGRGHLVIFNTASPPGRRLDFGGFFSHEIDRLPRRRFSDGSDRPIQGSSPLQSHGYTTRFAIPEHGPGNSRGSGRGLCIRAHLVEILH